ncbi:MAG: bifunctional 4-hydroxy-2-oxoglutarate aldolase/2-dehydro-3-deoxy-phosphogluconate aldolase [Flavitalea sp.]
MSYTDIVFNTITEQGLVPLFYHDDPQLCVSITKALYDGGVRILEFTNRGAAALENFRILRKEVDKNMPGMHLGIGTIKTANDANDFVEAGTDFIVCPIVHPGVAEVAYRASLLWIPGCLTTTEIALAEENGAKLVKIFPGSLVGPSYISAIKDIFPDMKFMPTGGVDMTKESIASWFNAGVVAVGMGSKLITKQVLESAAYKTLTEASAEALSIVHSVKK